MSPKKSPKNRNYLSPMEEDLMEMFWKFGIPMTSKDIATKEYERSWKDGYLKFLLRSLVDLGALRICDVRADGSKYLRVYEPLLTREQYAAKVASAHIEDKEQISKTMVAFAKENAADDEELIKRLEEIIEELRKG